MLFLHSTILMVASIGLGILPKVKAFEACRDERNNDKYEDNYFLATSVFGGVSVIVCFSAIIVIIAYKKDLMTLRDRIILGLMVANVIFSIGNLVPETYFMHDCTRIISVVSEGWIRGIWILGKYYIVSRCSGQMHEDIALKMFG